jgi:hypothetical protein
LDESGIEDNACRLKGWSNIGLRCYDERKYRDSLRVSMIAALNDGKIIDPQQHLMVIVMAMFL